MSEAFVILVVEDDELHRKMLIKVLGVLGYDVLVAIDGNSAVELAGLKRPDLILMDINMPGMDGLVATSLIKKDPLTAGIPVIALTAQAMAGDQEKALAAGCNDYLAKPALIKTLGDKLAEWLDKSRQPATSVRSEKVDGGRS